MKQPQITIGDEEIAETSIPILLTDNGRDFQLPKKHVRQRLGDMGLVRASAGSKQSAKSHRRIA